jgi:hypothetical protein
MEKTTVSIRSQEPPDLARLNLPLHEQQLRSPVLVHADRPRVLHQQDHAVRLLITRAVTALPVGPDGQQDANRIGVLMGLNGSSDSGFGRATLAVA